MSPKLTYRLLKAILMLVVCSQIASAQSLLKPYTAFQHNELNVLMKNWDLARDKKTLFVHFEVRNPGATDLRCPWKELVSFVLKDGSFMRSNYDALVDVGTGFTRATGPVLIPRGGKKVQIAVPFLLSPNQFPGHIQLSDGRISPTLR